MVLCIHNFEFSLSVSEWIWMNRNCVKWLWGFSFHIVTSKILLIKSWGYIFLWNVNFDLFEPFWQFRVHELLVLFWVAFILVKDVVSIYIVLFQKLPIFQIATLCRLRCSCCALHYRATMRGKTAKTAAFPRFCKIERVAASVASAV